MTTATETDRRVTRFRLAVTKVLKPERHRERLAAVIEHLEQWPDARVCTLHDGATVLYLLVEPARPVRVQAAKDIASTCPFYVAKSFKPLA